MFEQCAVKRNRIATAKRSLHSIQWTQSPWTPIEMCWCSTSTAARCTAAWPCRGEMRTPHQPWQLRSIYHFHFPQWCHFTTSFTLMYFSVFVESMRPRPSLSSHRRFNDAQRFHFPCRCLRVRVPAEQVSVVECAAVCFMFCASLMCFFFFCFACSGEQNQVITLWFNNRHLIRL